MEREYLTQTHRIEAQIDSKLARVNRLRTLAEKCTACITGMPRGTRGKHYADYLAEALALEDEIAVDMCRLRQTEAEIGETIARIQDERYRKLLELRYQCGCTWEEVAEYMHYDVRWVYALHKKALAVVRPQAQHGSSGLQTV